MNNIDESWQLIDWGTICRLCPYVDEFYNKMDFESDYNLDYNGFINEIGNVIKLTPLVSQWWNEQPRYKKYRYLLDQLFKRQDNCTDIIQVLQPMMDGELKELENLGTDNEQHIS